MSHITDQLAQADAAGEIRDADQILDFLTDELGGDYQQRLELTEAVLRDDVQLLERIGDRVGVDLVEWVRDLQADAREQVEGA